MSGNSKTYAYFLAVIVMFLLWVTLFLWRKDLRRQMLIMSILGMPAAFTEAMIVPVYWHPTVVLDLLQKFGICVETALYDFVWAGIGSVIYELIHRMGEQRNATTLRGVIYRFMFLTVVLFPAVIILSHTSLARHLLSEMIPAVAVGLIVVYVRRDLIRPALFSAAYVGISYFAIFAIFNLVFPEFVAATYNTRNLAGVYLLKVPIEEIAIGGIGGFTMGCTYEYVFDIRLIHLASETASYRKP